MTASCIAITGALGNLGTKLARHLLSGAAARRVVCIDARVASDEERGALETVAARGGSEVVFRRGDLADAGDPGWREPLAEADAVVHFAARNPYPEASWGDCAASMDITFNVALAADAAGVGRFVFATSNHVMGRYKDPPRADGLGAGGLGTDLEPGVGTVWHTGVEQVDSTPYAVAKLAGERMLRSLTARPGATMTCVGVRIGWCQPGENRPDTLSATGTPTLTGDAGGADAVDLARSDRWFKGMWLSNRDFTAIMERAIDAAGGDWPQGCIVVNGVSGNAAMAWSLEESRRLLGYEPLDDVGA